MNKQLVACVMVSLGGNLELCLSRVPYEYVFIYWMLPTLRDK